MPGASRISALPEPVASCWPAPSCTGAVVEPEQLLAVHRGLALNKGDRPEGDGGRCVEVRSYPAPEPVRQG